MFLLFVLDQQHNLRIWAASVLGLISMWWTGRHVLLFSLYSDLAITLSPLSHSVSCKCHQLYLKSSHKPNLFSSPSQPQPELPWSWQHYFRASSLASGLFSLVAFRVTLMKCNWHHSILVFKPSIVSHLRENPKFFTTYEQAMVDIPIIGINLERCWDQKS